MEKSFKPGINKQDRVIFSYKLQKLNYPSSTFNGNNVSRSDVQKELGISLNSKLDFKEHIHNVVKKVIRTIGLLHKPCEILTIPPLITISRSFIRAF